MGVNGIGRRCGGGGLEERRKLGKGDEDCQGGFSSEDKELIGEERGVRGEG